MAFVLTTVTIDLMSLLYIVLALIGAAVLVTLLILLIKLIKTLNSVNALLEDIKPDIKETTEKIPGLVDDVAIITGNVVDVTDAVAVTVPAIMKKITPKPKPPKSPKQKNAQSLEGIIASAAFSTLASMLSSRGDKKKKKHERSTPTKVIHTISRLVALFTKK